MISISKAFALAIAFIPSLVAAECVNSESFRFFIDGKSRSCRNIRIKEERRVEACADAEVQEACPQACGVCCENVSGYTFTRNNGMTGTCDWLGAKEVRVDRYCPNTKKAFNGRTVRDGCPVACDFCQTFIPVATFSPAPTAIASASPTGGPTSSPTDMPSSTPSVAPSKLPTASPTRPPSPMPSPFPTLAPTSMPSESPSENPSAPPSDVPTKLPSVSPSDVPTKTPSEAPSDAPSTSPSTSPSSSPSTSPSGSPTKLPSFMPSSVPTSEPSDIPTSTPSETPSMVPTVDPSDAPSNTPTESIKPSAIPTGAPFSPTPTPTAVPTTSPSMLPTSSPSLLITDDPTFTFILTNVGTEVDCSWITKNLQKIDIRMDYCDDAEIAAACAATCG